MRRASLLLLSVIVLSLLAATSSGPAAAQPGDVTLVHSPPEGVTPGHQVYLTAVLTNATAASIAWRNDSMTSNAIVPMTNLSKSEGGGWGFAAYLPAQPTPTLVTYTITATGPAGEAQEAFQFVVDVPAAEGLSQEQQMHWILTLVASLSMAASVVAAFYWYIGRRLRRGVA